MSGAGTDSERRSGPRFIQVVHLLPGRSRFRLSWLHAEPSPAELERLADELSRLEGMKEVEIRAYTGRVLCLHDPERLDHKALLEHLARLTGVETTLGPDDRPPVPPPVSGDGPGEVARQVARLFKGLDDDVLTATDGKLDMGTLATFGFLGAGALNVMTRRNLSTPPWFNLAWWGLRTFMLFEADAVNAPSAGNDGGAG